MGTYLAVVPLGCSSDSATDAGGAGGGANVPTSGEVTVGGLVTGGDSPVSRGPIAGATVTIKGDFDADGTVEASEVATATTDDKGAYSVKFDLKGKTALSVVFSASDMLTQRERLVISPPGVGYFNGFMSTAQELTVEGTTAALSNGRLVLEGIPAGLHGVARVFDPSTESDAFAGEFMDNLGNPIVSAVFCKVDLRNDQDEEVHDFGTPATMKMEIPRTRWPVVRDMVKGNDRIDTPQYHFDRDKAQWVEEEMGYLVDGTGQMLTEDQLPSILAGTFPSKLIAVHNVSGFPDRNVDYRSGLTPPNVATGAAKAPKGWFEKAQNAFACAMGMGICYDPSVSAPPATPIDPQFRRRTGDLLWNPPKSTSLPSGLSPQDGTGDAELVPLTGAYIRAELFYPDGTSAGHYTADVEADGSFNLQVARSEPDGEDLDENGVKGEKMTLFASVEWNGYVFQLLEGEVPSTPGYVANMGDLDMSQTWLVTSRCEVNGVVKYLDGSPAAGASIWFTGNTPTEAEQIKLCGVDGANCNESATTGADGTFKVASTMSDVFSVSAFLSDVQAESSATYYGYKEVYGFCPTTPVTVLLDSANIETKVTVTWDGTNISWSPARALNWVEVYQPYGDTRWSVSAGAPIITPPVQYGVAPPGTFTDTPATQQPVSGDLIHVAGWLTTDKGYSESVEGSYLIP